jgi:hypothetical protein
MEDSSERLLQLQSLQQRLEACIGAHPVPARVDLDERRLNLAGLD